MITCLSASVYSITYNPSTLHHPRPWGYISLSPPSTPPITEGYKMWWCLQQTLEESSPQDHQHQQQSARGGGTAGGARSCLQVLLTLLLLLTRPDTSVDGVVYDSRSHIAPDSNAAAGNATSRPPSSALPVAPLVSRQHVLWADAALGFLQGLNCDDVYFTTERECRHLAGLVRAAVGVYTAGPVVAGRLAAVLPDGGLAASGVHDGYVVLDPYPAANFGHLVLVFHVTLHLQEDGCQRRQGIYIQENGDCLILALKRRCKNALERRWRRRNFARRCEINFLPLVYLETDTSPRRQLLTCRQDLPGFAPCPQLRPLNETSDLFCNPLRENTKRCETSHERVHTSCRVFEVCDQAVLLSGGWNRQGSLPRHVTNVRDVYGMLRGHGFRRKNIKVFFANGIDGGIVDGDHQHEVYPAALKLAMRYHLQKMCSSPHCVDSLFLYLNGPAKSDGTMLLWDVDGDGIAGEKERYSLEELLSDLSDCHARQVHILADQSFSGEISRAVKRSHHHSNVVVLAGSKDHEYSWGSEYTRHWTTTNHTHRCVQDVFKETRKKMTLSTPEMEQGARAANMTIFGAPCDVMPPFNHRELHQNYLGCQNLPTALWVIKMLSVTQNSDPDNDARPTRATSLQRHDVGSRDT